MRFLDNMHRCQLENKKEWKHNAFFFLSKMGKVEKMSLYIRNGHGTYCAFNGGNTYYNLGV